MGSESSVRVELLGEDNYVTWKWQITMILKQRKLYDCVIGKPSSDEENEKAAPLLASTLTEYNMQRVINCTTAAEIWSSLEANFENKSSSQRAMLMEKFTSFQINSIGDISRDLGEIQALAAKLKSLGLNVEDEFIISIILKGLPSCLQDWKRTWRMVNDENPNLNKLITALLAEVNELKRPEEESWY